MVIQEKHLRRLMKIMTNKLSFYLFSAVCCLSLFAGQRVKPELLSCNQVIWTSNECPTILRSGTPNMDIIVDALFDDGKIVKITPTSRVQKQLFENIKRGVSVKDQSGWRFIRVKMKFEVGKPLIRVMLCPCEH